MSALQGACGTPHKQNYLEVVTKMSAQTQHIVKFHTGFLESSCLPKTGRMVTAKSLLPKEADILGKNSVALFVKFEDNVYAARPDELVPAESVIERDDAGQVCGIPAVTGG